jgi:arginine:pyruvate transaminase
MQLSQRITDIKGNGSDGWEVYYRTRELIESGVSVANLTIGEHDIKTDRSILDAMHAATLAGNTGYSFGPGNKPLREEIAARVQERTGVSTKFSNVIVTAGGQAALFASHMALLAQGDRALFCDPYYATYPGTIRAAGAIPVSIPTLSSQDFQPKPEAILAKAVGAKTLLINTPNNPTGVVYSGETLDGIAQACQQANLWLISDEVYDTQVWQGKHITPRSLPGMLERTLVVGSMSKSHAMTGSRLGWIVASEEVINAVSLLATNTTYAVPSFIQHAALFALQLGSEFEENIAAPFRRRRAISKQIIEAQNRMRLVSDAGYYCDGPYRKGFCQPPVGRRKDCGDARRKLWRLFGQSYPRCDDDR